VQDLSDLQHWLEKHGNRVEVLQLQECDGAALAALPCSAQLQDLLLHHLSMASRTWGDIASATKLTSISLSSVQTASQQADVVAALTALPNLEQLTWCKVHCSDPLGKQNLSDSSLLQQMTQLTSLKLQFITASDLQHLGSLTKLQHLDISDADDWLAAGCPGLQELKALTSLKLVSWGMADLPASASQLTALRQLEVGTATHTALNQLQVLTGLTHLRVSGLTGTSSFSARLQLPSLQHLELGGDFNPIMPMSFLDSCTQLQLLKVTRLSFQGFGSLVAPCCSTWSLSAAVVVHGSRSSQLLWAGHTSRHWTWTCAQLCNRRTSIVWRRVVAAFRCCAFTTSRTAVALRWRACLA